MAKSNEPMVWSLFSAGGMISALVTPVLILITGITVPLGVIGSDAIGFERAHAFAANPLGKLILLGLVILPLWHCAHRFRAVMVDLGPHGAKTAFGVVCYGFALVCSILAIVTIVPI
ncbi:MAG: fumarate reductase subunit D [bacterium]|nr:fumarate reductase subunit D [bacterium]